jgi:hypothetical protein
MKKSVGRPKTTGKGTQCVVRLHDPLLSEIDDWCEEQPYKVTRAQALRNLAALALGLDKNGEKPTKRKR